MAGPAGRRSGSGSSTGRLKSVVRFNMESNKWEEWGEMFQARSAPGVAFSQDGEYMYVAGGSDGSEKLKVRHSTPARPSVVSRFAPSDPAPLHASLDFVPEPWMCLWVARFPYVICVAATSGWCC